MQVCFYTAVAFDMLFCIFAPLRCENPRSSSIFRRLNVSMLPYIGAPLVFGFLLSFFYIAALWFTVDHMKILHCNPPSVMVPIFEYWNKASSALISFCLSQGSVENA